MSKRKVKIQQFMQLGRMRKCSKYTAAVKYCGICRDFQRSAVYLLFTYITMEYGRCFKKYDNLFGLTWNWCNCQALSDVVFVASYFLKHYRSANPKTLLKEISNKYAGLRIKCFLVKNTSRNSMQSQIKSFLGVNNSAFCVWNSIPRVFLEKFT